MNYTMRVIDSDEIPKRGDLQYTAVGTKRQRTWIILAVKPGKDRRHKIWRARWWELEPLTRQRLGRAAERAGGQQCWFQQPGKPGKRRKKIRPEW